MQKIRNDKRSHLVFKLSYTSSHTRSTFLSPLSNCFINYALVKFYHGAIEVIFVLYCIVLKFDAGKNLIGCYH